MARSSRTFDGTKPSCGVMLVNLLFALIVADASHEEARYDSRRSELIDSINSHPAALWTAGFNPRFTGQPIGASKDLCGVLPSSKQKVNDAIRAGTVKVAPYKAVRDIPDSFDAAIAFPLCAELINDIRDQSNCGCCWAFAAAEAASDRMCISTKGQIKVPLSAEDMCFCGSRNGCGGGIPIAAWAKIKENGLVTGGQFNSSGGGYCSDFSLPHCHHHGPQNSDPYPAEGAPACPKVNTSPACPTACDANAKAPHNSFASDKYTFKGQVYVYRGVDQISQAIMEQGPVEATFSVYSDFENYVSGIYHHVNGTSLGGHAVKIVGWGTEGGVSYWKVANSWNPFWGEDGFFRIRRGVDEAFIEDQVTASDPKATWAKM